MPPKGITKDILSDKERDFVSYYCNPASKTYHKKLESFIAAGYSDTRSAIYNVSRLINSDKIIKAMADFRSKQAIIDIKQREINAEYALVCLQETYDEAKRLSDVTNQVACVRLMMQKCGLLSERVVVDVTDSRQLEQSLVMQAKKIASVILSDELPELMSGNNIDTQPVANTDNVNQAIIDSALTDDTQVVDNQ